MSDRKSYYIHTLNGKPAFFDGDQICYATIYQRAGNVACKSLQQIRREQVKSERWRYEMFGEQATRHQYGYVRFTVPQETSHD